MRQKDANFKKLLISKIKLRISRIGAYGQFRFWAIHLPVKKVSSDCVVFDTTVVKTRVAHPYSGIFLANVRSNWTLKLEINDEINSPKCLVVFLYSIKKFPHILVYKLRNFGDFEQFFPHLTYKRVSIDELLSSNLRF